LGTWQQTSAAITDREIDRAAAAMLRRLQWVAFGGFLCSVMCTTCFIFSGLSGLTRDGRLASFSSPSTPCRHSVGANGGR
jgi:hypothetical protein